MKSLLKALFIFLFINTVPAQTFTWMKGISTGSVLGTYGTLGVSSSLNNPGARNDVQTWTDTNGNFWLFGGYGVDKHGKAGLLNDLWKYVPATNEWTWVGGDSAINKIGVYGNLGVASSGNKLGARRMACTWTDNNGNLWLFGGYAITNSGLGYLNDLWKYNIASNQWTWMSGSMLLNQPGSYGVKGTPSVFNTPGARVAPVSSFQSTGKLWLFGGNGMVTSSFGLMNDLWCFDMSTSQWTWVSGANVGDLNGVYGTQGVSSPTVYPGARYAGYCWSDASAFYIFGGNGMDAVNTTSATMYLNDVWKYSFSTNQWTWKNGSSLGSQQGVYGAQEVFASTNSPGGHVAGISYKDSQDKFWFFGGHGLNASSGGKLGDLWKYDPVINQWAFMQGHQLSDQQGIYGTQGIPSIANRPGCRASAGGWIDQNNDIWIFGGFGWPGNNGWIDVMNDLWKYKNCSSLSFSLTANPDSICSVGPSTIIANGASTYTWAPSVHTNSIVVNSTATNAYSVSATFTNGCVKTYSVLVSVFPAPVLTVTATKTVLCTGESVTLSVAGASTYVWYQGSNSYTGSTLFLTNLNASSLIQVVGTQGGCSTNSSIPLNVDACTTLGELEQTKFKIYPNPAQNYLLLKSDANIFQLFNIQGKEVLHEVINSDGKINVSSLNPGLYFYKCGDNTGKIFKE